jgi:hypothetical protein
MSFKRLFIFEWLRLKANPREGLGYLFGNHALKQKFVEGSGLDVELQQALTTR